MLLLEINVLAFFLWVAKNKALNLSCKGKQNSSCKGKQNLSRDVGNCGKEGLDFLLGEGAVGAFLEAFVQGEGSH